MRLIKLARPVSGSDRYGSGLGNNSGVGILPEIPIARAQTSNQISTILADIKNNKYQFPPWFMNNVRWVESGQITEDQFLDSFNYLVNNGEIFKKPVAVQQAVQQATTVETFCFDYYDVRQTSKGNYVTQSFHYDGQPYHKIKSLIDEQKMVRLCGSSKPTDIEIFAFYDIKEADKIPTITQEPEIEVPEDIPEIIIPVETFDIIEYRIQEGSIIKRYVANITQDRIKEIESEGTFWTYQNNVAGMQEVYDFYGFTVDDPSVLGTAQDPYMDIGGLKEPIIPDPNEGMISQSIGTFEICPCEQENRVKGSIMFIANSDPAWKSYYGKTLTHILQIKDSSGLVIDMKYNNLNFTLTNRDVTLTFDQNAHFNETLTLESYVWLSAQEPLTFSTKKVFTVTQEIKQIIDPITNETTTLCQSRTNVEESSIKRTDGFSKLGGLIAGITAVSLTMIAIGKAKIPGRKN